MPHFNVGWQIAELQSSYLAGVVISFQIGIALITTFGLLLSIDHEIIKTGFFFYIALTIPLALRILQTLRDTYLEVGITRALPMFFFGFIINLIAPALALFLFVAKFVKREHNLSRKIYRLLLKVSDIQRDFSPKRRPKRAASTRKQPEVLVKTGAPSSRYSP